MNANETQAAILASTCDHRAIRSLFRTGQISFVVCVRAFARRSDFLAALDRIYA